MKFLFLSLLIFLSCFAQAQSTWTQVPSGTSKRLLDLQFTSNQTGYISGEGGTFLKTTDGGNTWLNLTFDTTLTWPIPISFLNDNMGFLSDQHRIFKTIDGGLNWVLKYEDSSAYLSALKFVTEDLAFAANSNKILRTTDGGDTWQVVEEAENDIRTISFPSPGVGYFTGGSGYAHVYKTTDSGNTFQAYANAQTTVREEMQFINDTVGYLTGWYLQMIQKTTDGGQTWSVIPDSTYMAGGMSVHFLTEDIGYFVSSNGEIKSTTDGGLNWDLELTASSSGSLWDLKKLTSTATHLYCIGDSGRIYKKSLPLAIATIPAAISGQLYPNPTTGLLTLNDPDATVYQVFDPMGRMIRQGKILQQQIDISELPAGHYIIQIKSEKMGTRSYQAVKR